MNSWVKDNKVFMGKLSEKRLQKGIMFSKMFLWMTICRLNSGLLGGIIL